MNVVVVGAGLFGSIITDHLHKLGHVVTVVADQRPDMGSLPAACLMKPSWAASMGGEYEDAIGLLDYLYGVKEIEFDLRPTKARTTCHWVDPAEVLRAPDIRGSVEAWHTDGSPLVAPADGSPRYWMDRPDAVVVATGSWADQWDPELKGRLKAQGGWSFRYPGHLPRPFIEPWAPYKQLVAFEIAPGEVWVGDGSALKPESLTDARYTQSQARGWEALKRAGFASSGPKSTWLRGFRPKVVGLREPAYIRELPREHPMDCHRFVVTGGAKNGTLGAAWAARQIGAKLT